VSIEHALAHDPGTLPICRVTISLLLEKPSAFCSYMTAPLSHTSLNTALWAQDEAAWSASPFLRAQQPPATSKTTDTAALNDSSSSHPNNCHERTVVLCCGRAYACAHLCSEKKAALLTSALVLFSAWFCPGTYSCLYSSTTTVVLLLKLTKGSHRSLLTLQWYAEVAARVVLLSHNLLRKLHVRTGTSETYRYSC
jgi:hypothetical protein